MLIEAERLLVGSPGCQGENPIALFACPLLAGLGQGLATSASLCPDADRQRPTVGLALVCKVGTVRYSCEAKSFSLLVCCYDDHRLLSLLFDASCNPIMGSYCHLVCFTPGWYANGP